jgi:hypothetical protein
MRYLNKIGLIVLLLLGLGWLWRSCGPQIRYGELSFGVSAAKFSELLPAAQDLGSGTDKHGKVIDVYRHDDDSGVTFYSFANGKLTGLVVFCPEGIEYDELVAQLSEMNGAPATATRAMGSRATGWAKGNTYLALMKLQGSKTVIDLPYELPGTVESHGTMLFGGYEE